jgi:hypothetical protein
VLGEAASEKRCLYAVVGIVGLFQGSVGCQIASSFRSLHCLVGMRERAGVKRKIFNEMQRVADCNEKATIMEISLRRRC